MQTLSDLRHDAKTALAFFLITFVICIATFIIGAVTVYTYLLAVSYLALLACIVSFCIFASTDVKIASIEGEDDRYGIGMVDLSDF